MTRIVAGRFRGRRLDVPKGRDVRPTTDRMRERLFSMLMHGRYPDMTDAVVADIFAGTGALGLEALSRGAARVTFVEQARPSVACINANIGTLGVSDQATILAKNATNLPPANAPCDFIFMDPPYRQGLVRPTLDSILAQGWLSEDGVIVCEQAADEPIDIPDALNVVDDRSQGQQRILFLLRK
ncbi:MULTISPECIES: 16S rRNA (guanine(966)-N(2))-methyltransferase RsmD [Kordiimonas]|jgi:16S rRNA (guanine966-N2)-methyltransferase|uniref:16S rRNA (guanine(966)-N(2))-methyltransferase RsmD n=1 Tax=Kordiimonas TaxID=288021 RepID=UPI00257E6D52|nr:16S rRNA (guanine(966)-N(2))-methyltransferase RsmD [Kordiimonas sp. UBA4487]